MSLDSTFASFSNMLPNHLVLQLWWISVNLTVRTLGYADEHSIVHDPAARRACRARVCALARHTYARKRRARGAARRDAILHARGARRWNEILEHASPVLGSGLSKIGRTGDSGIVTPKLDRGGSEARGAGR